MVQESSKHSKTVNQSRYQGCTSTGKHEPWHDHAIQKLSAAAPHPSTEFVTKVTHANATCPQLWESYAQRNIEEQHHTDVMIMIIVFLKEGCYSQVVHGKHGLWSLISQRRQIHTWFSMN
jgi:hypothetical protein